MEKEIYLIAPPAHQYELGALIREVWPLCKIYDQPAAGLRGIVVSPEKGSVTMEGFVTLPQTVKQPRCNLRSKNVFSPRGQSRLTLRLELRSRAMARANRIWLILNSLTLLA